MKLNIHEAKTRLSDAIAHAEAGERVLICKRNTPVAELRALHKPSGKPRPFGLLKGRFRVPARFFEPLPDSLLDEFEGRSG